MKKWQLQLPRDITTPSFKTVRVQDLPIFYIYIDSLPLSLFAHCDIILSYLRYKNKLDFI